MWFPISANPPPLKQSLKFRKEHIHTFNYHQGLTSFKMHFMLHKSKSKNRWPIPTPGGGGGVGRDVGLGIGVELASLSE